MVDYLDYVKITDIDTLLKRVKKIESMVRNSWEYKCWVASIHEDLCIHNCDYFKNWNDDDIDMEVHHIITLFDIVIAVGAEMISELENDEYLLSFQIANQVIEEHLCNNIPCILVSKTIHQAIHSNLYQPSPDSKSINLGNYLDFVKKYKGTLDMISMQTLAKYLPEDKIPELEEAYGEKITIAENRSI